MNRQAFEQRIAGFKLKFLQTRDNRAENSRLPSFLDHYHALVKTTKTIPDQETFIKDYLQVHGYEGNVGVEARARRAYSSLVREHHLGYVLAEHFTVEPYSTDFDKKYGIDYVIRDGEKRFFIHAFVDTPNANMWRNRKSGRHDESSLDGVHLDIAIDPKTARHVGEFWLYSENEVLPLKQRIQAHDSGY